MARQIYLQIYFQITAPHKSVEIISVSTTTIFIYTHLNDKSFAHLICNALSKLQIPPGQKIPHVMKVGRERNKNPEK
ncbi:MAG: hypothetical protein PHP13_00035 [Methanomicrobium sp.]|jgi:hypothetical protein|nr:hypothetical protein [Methanomicrobium sp.]MDD4299367.1 hypothetical protein [Methanomicrobium sp.]